MIKVDINVIGLFVIKGNFSIWEIDPLDFIKKDIRVFKSFIIG